MEEWKQDKLIDLLDSLIDYRGKTPRKVDKGIPLITAKIVKNGRIDTPTEFLDIEDYDNWMVRGFPKNGDVILTTEAPLGEVAQLDDNKIALAQRIVCLRGKKGVLDNTFLKYFLLSSLGQARLKARETGTTVTGIKQSELKEVLIDYPPYKYQKQITSILKSFDDKIELNRRINENLEQQAQALFKSWFVDFEPFKDGKFVDSEQGMIPEGWKVGNLEELVEVKYGKDHKKLAPGTIPVYGSGGIMRYVDQYLYNKESVLIPRKGSLNNVMYINRPFWTVDTMFYTRMKIEGIAKFIYLFMSPKDLLSMNSGSAVPSMTVDILNKIQIITPPINIIQKFECIMKPIFTKMDLCSYENQKLSQLRDTLLPRLMSGEIDVSEVEL